MRHLRCYNHCVATTIPQPAPAAAPPDPRRFLILAVCCMSLFIVGLDGTIVNVALPSIRADLGASVSELQWTIDAYTLVLASLLLLSGSMADRFGRARVFKLGLLLFTAGSLLCSVAPDVRTLIVARMLQAVGGSMLNPVAMSIIRNTFTDPRERAQAIGIWGGVIGISLALGPVLGGALSDGGSWRAIFWVNVPVGLAAIVLTSRLVPESRAPRPRRPDPVGQALIVVLLAATVFGIIEAPGQGWLSAQTLVLAAVSVAALAGLIAYERRRPEPVIDLRFFRSAPFAGATLMAIAAFVSLGGFLFLNTLYLQEARGLRPLHAGLLTLPMAAAAAILAPLTGRFVGRRGARLPLIAAGLGMGASAVLLTRVTPDTSTAYLLLAYVLFGIGFGCVNAPITNAAVSGMPAAQAGVAAAVASTSRMVGQSLGVAVVGAVAVSATGTPEQLAAAAGPGWWIIAGCGLFIVAAGVATTGEWALRTARATAREFGTT
ncbi:MAG: EmrB/QacA subfamily drug resistance transporter [Solirubrobacterales bacterium]|nr:EmrB/QacA subfamily drug resistance transporter [Solirubrobacterales bacterium]